MPIVPRHFISFTFRDFLTGLRCLCTGTFRSGRESAAFAGEFAAYIGGGTAIPVGSCRAGLTAVIRALELQDGDEVIVPACYFFSTPLSVRQAHPGVHIRYAPIDHDTYNLDTRRLAEQLSPRTRAIIVQHTFGRIVPMDPILALKKQYDFTVIEDCAQALGSTRRGAPAGSRGDVALFSFASGKNMTCGGGGMLVIRDPHLAGRLDHADRHLPGTVAEMKDFLSLAVQALLTRQPWYTCTVFPLLYLLNLSGRERLERLFREDETSASLPAADTALANWRAAVGRNQLRGVGRLNGIRREHAQQLLTVLRPLPGLHFPPDDPDACSGAYALPLRTANIAGMAQRLMQRGIDMRLDYMHYAPEAAPLAGTIAYLPNHPGLSAAVVARLATAIAAAVRAT